MTSAGKLLTNGRPATSRYFNGLLVGPRKHLLGSY